MREHYEMSFKPHSQESQEKLRQWAREREERGETRGNQPAMNTHPREGRSPDADHLAASVERFEALLGR
jgi:flagellar biosynthesis/type III secretory pathway protein FliH